MQHTPTRSIFKKKTFPATLSEVELQQGCWKGSSLASLSNIWQKCACIAGTYLRIALQGKPEGRRKIGLSSSLDMAK